MVFTTLRLERMSPRHDAATTIPPSGKKYLAFNWRSWVRFLTCNVHRGALVGSAMAQFIQKASPDIVLMQEWTSQDQDALFGKGGWNLQRDGELLMASRFPIVGSDDLFQGRWGPAGAAVCYHIDFNGREIRLINLHLASPHGQFDDAIHGAAGAADEMLANSAMRMDQSILISDIARCGSGGPASAPTILAGDFNTPSDSPIFKAAWGCFNDAFTYAGWGLGSTYFTHWSSTRIDHLLADDQWQILNCWVGPRLGSPHDPVVTDLCFTRMHGRAN